MDSAPSLQVRHSKAGCKRSQPDPRHPSKVSTSQIPCSSGVIAFATASKESFFRLRPPENRFAYLQASEPDFGWNKFVTAGSADGSEGFSPRATWARQRFRCDADHYAYSPENHHNHHKQKIKTVRRKDCARNDFYKLRCQIILF